MKQDYFKDKNTENEPRPQVIRRILAFSKSYKPDKKQLIITKKD
jgi:hypothetical protein